jgi:hypothetical protein
MKPLRLLTTCLLLGLTLTTGVAAQDVDEATLASARTLGYEGVEHFQRGDYSGAAERLDRAYQVVRAPSLGLWSARALVKVGRLVEASARSLEVTRLEVQSGDKAVQRKAQADAESEREALLPKIPSVVVQVEGAARAEVKVSIDGVAVPSALIGVKRLVNPGTHRIQASFGVELAGESVTLKEGESKVVSLRFPTGGASTAPSSPVDGVAADASADTDSTSGPGLGTQRVLALVAGGIGVVGVGVGTVFGLQAKSHHDEAKKYCKGAVCTDPRGVSAGDDARTSGNVSTIAMIIGAVGVAGGVTLWLTAPRANATAARVELGLGRFEVGGTF